MRRPRFIAEQARNAQGLLGWLIASIMARETWGVNQRAIAALEVEPRDHILDAGCGHGRSLATLAALAPRGRVVGVDPSELMVRIAAKRNRALVRRQAVEVVVASSDAMPLPDASFDKAMCVHVVYFWPDLGLALREIARVLKPGGRLVLVFRTDADATATAAFPADVYRFPTRDEILVVLVAAGFATDPSDGLAVEQHNGPILLIATKHPEPASQPESENAGVLS